MPIDNPTVTEKSVSVDVDGGKPTGSRRSFTPVLLAMVFIAFAFGLAGAIVGAVLTERLSDLQSKVDALEAKAAITEGIVVTRSAVPPAGHVFGGVAAHWQGKHGHAPRCSPLPAALL